MSVARVIQTLALAALALTSVATCIDLPPPLRNRAVTNAGGVGGQPTSSTSSNGAHGGLHMGGGHGGDANAPPLPVCSGGRTEECVHVNALALGGTHSCARTDDGLLRCWGDNLWRQLGDDVLSTHREIVVLAHVQDAEHTAAGLAHNCILKTGDVQCWGRNTVGQLGDNSTIDSAKPVTVAINEVVQLDTLFTANCALQLPKAVSCWGFSLNGQGYSGVDGGAFNATPILVDGFEDVASIDLLRVGSQSACAIINDHAEVRCWGQGIELGDGTGAPSASAVSVLGLPAPIHMLDTGERHCVVAGTDRQLLCWGDSYLSDTPDLLPVPVPGIDANHIVAIGTGWQHTCALMDDQTVRCWGRGDYGALGADGVSGSDTPIPILGLGTVVSMEIGWQHNCVITSEGEVRCWGRNHAGQVDPLSPDRVLLTASTVVWR